jgi:hypothetical protein
MVSKVTLPRLPENSVKGFVRVKDFVSRDFASRDAIYGLRRAQSCRRPPSCLSTEPKHRSSANKRSDIDILVCPPKQSTDPKPKTDHILTPNS